MISLGVWIGKAATHRHYGMAVLPFLATISGAHNLHMDVDCKSSLRRDYSHQDGQHSHASDLTRADFPKDTY